MPFYPLFFSLETGAARAPAGIVTTFLPHIIPRSDPNLDTHVGDGHKTPPRQYRGREPKPHWEPYARHLEKPKKVLRSDLFPG